MPPICLPDSMVKKISLIACFAVCTFGLTYNIAGYSLLDPDEGRNAEVAREMWVTGDYVIPHLNGLPYLDKPILYFTAGATSMRFLGPTEFAARLPSLLFTVATVLLVAWFGTTAFGSGAGIVAAVATASTPFTLAYARVVIFDSALTFFIVAALVSFYMAVEMRMRGGRAEGRKGGREINGGTGATDPGCEDVDEDATAPATYRATAHEGWTAIAWVAMGFGVLTKGPVALVLPLLVAAPFAWRYRAWKALGDPIAVLLFLAIVAPWLVAVSLRVPDFLEYALVTETLQRFSTTNLNRTGPVWYFLTILPAAALPWTLVVAGTGPTLISNRDEAGRLDRRIFFLLLWIVLPLLLFTISQSKRPQYVLPLVPAVALLVAAAWQARPNALPGARLGAGGITALGLFFLAAAPHIPNFVPASPGVAAHIPGTAVFLGAVCVGAGILAWFAHKRWDVLLLAFSLPVAAIPVSSRGLMEGIGEDRSAAPLARAIAGATGPATPVVGVGAFPPSLPFYLQRTITVATADGSEITSNYLTRHIREYRGLGSQLRKADWWRDALLACPQPTVFVARSNDQDVRDVLAHMDLIAETRKYVAYGPCGLETLARVDR